MLFVGPAASVFLERPRSGTNDAWRERVLGRVLDSWEAEEGKENCYSYEIATLYTRQLEMRRLKSLVIDLLDILEHAGED